MYVKYTILFVDVTYFRKKYILFPRYQQTFPILNKKKINNDYYDFNFYHNYRLNEIFNNYFNYY